MLQIGWYPQLLIGAIQKKLQSHFIGVNTFVWLNESHKRMQVDLEFAESSAKINAKVSDIQSHFVNDGPAAKRGWAKFISQVSLALMSIVLSVSRIRNLWLQFPRNGPKFCKPSLVWDLPIQTIYLIKSCGSTIRPYYKATNAANIPESTSACSVYSHGILPRVLCSAQNCYQHIRTIYTLYQM